MLVGDAAPNVPAVEMAMSQRVYTLTELNMRSVSRRSQRKKQRPAATEKGENKMKLIHAMLIACTASPFAAGIAVQAADRPEPPPRPDAPSRPGALQPPTSPLAEEPPGPWKAPKGFEFTWTPRFFQIVSNGDPARGEKLAKKAKCSRCHGDVGISEDDDTPSMAGQVAPYIFKQLVDYASNARKNRTMKKAVRKLSLQDMADLGAFYQTQTPEQAAGGHVPALVNKDDLSQLVIGCDACHNESKEFRGMMDIPATLHGQKVGYFVETMTAFKTGDRANDLHAHMRNIASQLREDEIQSLANYYSAPPSKE